MEQASKRYCVVVAGMHRSGTSAVARVLNLLGCALPETLVPANVGNSLGHWESLPIVQLNDAILESAGSFWDDWTACSPAWFSSPVAEEFLGRAIETVRAEYGDARLLVMKDPRLCRLLRFWIPALRASAIEPLVLVPLRNPLEVARSLTARDGSELHYNLLVWLRHVLDTEAASRGVRRHFFGYGDLLARWTATMDRAGEALGLSWPRASARVAGDIERHLSSEHRHHAIDPAVLLEDLSIPEWVREAYRIFDRWAANGESAADFPALDRIRAELDASAATFGRILLHAKYARGEANELAEKLKQKDALEQELAAEQARLEAARRSAENLMRHLDLLREDVARLEADVEAEADRARAAQAAQARAEGQIEALVQAMAQEPHAPLILRRSQAMRRKAALLARAGVIDPAAYLAANEDVARAGMDPAFHYLTAGVHENRRRAP
jgi:hypothetical protein